MNERLDRWAREHGVSEEALRDLRAMFGELPAARSDAPSGASGLPDRYEDRGRISRGGSAEVRRVWDRVLARDVAMKILWWDHIDSTERRARFLNEARITGRLEHPGIVPVHDRGLLADGRPWFTMKEVRGRTLTEVLATEPVAEPAARRRLVDALARVCEAVGYAHTRRIVHRDLKPANLMLGPFGEVWVLDWGIARDLGDDPSSDVAIPGPDGVLAADRSATRTGEIFGTLAYMSPEQARGWVSDIGPASDVWTIGLILFEILTGQRAFTGSTERVWVDISQAKAPAIPAGTSLPDELTAVYRRAVQPTPADRLPDALALRDALKAWLDGDAQRRRARSLVGAAEGLRASIDLLERQERSAREEAKLLRSHLHAFDPVEHKRPVWELEDRAGHMEQERAALEAEQIERLRAALQHDPECEQAHGMLAEIYRSNVLRAEVTGELAKAARYEVLLRRHDRGEHRAFLDGRGALTLHTASRARVVARPYRRESRRLVHGDPIELGETPIDAREMDAGSYLLEILGDDRVPVRHAVRIGRDEHVDGIPPGATEPFAIPLPHPGELGADEVYVPAGWVTVGGDELAAEAVPRRRVWIDGFVINRFPVTLREYLEFLDALARENRAHEAERAAPRLARGTADPHIDVLGVVRRADGGFALAPDEHGRPASPRWPVSNIDWFSAVAYCQWRSERDARDWRLPNELEWEKAARAGDERAFPWGNEPEPTWACILGATREEPCRVDVDAYPTDESPYGVRGLAGNVRDWCVNPWRPDGPPISEGRLQLDPADTDDETSLRSIRGGAWQTVPAFARAAGRFASAPRDRFAVLGFRLARSFRTSDRS